MVPRNSLVQFFPHHRFSSPAQLVEGFTLSGLLPDKPWSQVSSLPSPPRYSTCLHFFYRAQGSFSIPTARRLSSHVANSRSRAFSKPLFVQEKVLSSMHSVTLEPTKLVLGRHADRLPSQRGRRLPPAVYVNHIRICVFMV